MNLTLIAAISSNQVIGYNQTIPWEIPEDIKYFRETTMGQTIVMGRKTYESIGKPLLGRKNIVITSSIKEIRGVQIINSPQELLKNIKNIKNEIFIIGGQKVYEEFLPFANKMHITEIDLKINGDSFFPVWNRSEWKEISRTPKKNIEAKINYSFVVLERI